MRAALAQPYHGAMLAPSPRSLPAAVARLTLACAAVLLAGCSEEAPGPGAGAPLTTETLRGTLLHLDAELARARVTAAPAPARAARTWSFPADAEAFEAEPAAGVTLERRADALRLVFAPTGGMPPFTCLRTELEGGARADWSALEVRARTHDRLGGLASVVNPGAHARLNPFFFFGGDEDSAPLFSDGSLQTYHLPLAPGEGQLEELGLLVASMGPGALDLVAVTLVPRGADFPLDVGVGAVTREALTRTTLYAHAPAVLAWRIAVPAAAARLDLALTTLPGEAVEYAVHVRTDGRSEELARVSVADSGTWQPLSVDLARFGGSELELELAATSAQAGALALWGAPILSGAAAAASAPEAPRAPNVLFYVIDGAGADLMSVNGYARPTTPYLEQLAEEGVVFERAHANSTWTQPSTASFMTGLQHSVLGGLRRGLHSTPVPRAATTMAEHFRRGGWQTASFTSNPNAGRVIGLERGLDVMRDAETAHHSTSSLELHELFWRFRTEYPGGPTWVHFQTTDVHEPNEPVAPFAGRFVSPEERAELERWDGRLFQEAGDLFGTTSIAGFYDAALARTGIDRKRYFEARRGLYDETMAHQDRALERFVGELKARGEWEHTLLVIAADHGHPAGTFARFGRGLLEPQPEPWQGALFDAYATRVPLIFVWPGKIEGGRRVREPVSMLDVLPTLLELCGLPPAADAQGHSLAPYLLRGEAVAHEVVLDEFRVDEGSGEWIGNLELVDGRWGASLELGPVPAGADPAHGRHAVPAGGRWGALHPFFPEAPRLLLYDLAEDPFATRAVNDAHPELVTRYAARLAELWQAHRALAQRFVEAEEPALDTEQLEQLQALGYVR